MITSVNRVVLVGEIGRNGVEVRTTQGGGSIASFVLCLSELGMDGKPHATLVQCQVVGKKAQHLVTLTGGTLVAFDGRIDKRKAGERYETVCTAFDLQVLSATSA